MRHGQAAFTIRCAVRGKIQFGSAASSSELLPGSLSVRILVDTTPSYTTYLSPNIAQTSSPVVLICGTCVNAPKRRLRCFATRYTTTGTQKRQPTFPSHIKH